MLQMDNAAGKERRGFALPHTIPLILTFSHPGEGTWPDGSHHLQDRI